MTTELIHCPHAASASPPDCSRRLVLADSLARFEREAKHGVVDTGHYRCRYYRWGQGPALVFIPGLCSNGAAFAPLISRLQQHYECVAYDLPTGVDDGAHLADYAHADLVADLLALLDQLRRPRAALFGSSFGSTIALGALHRQPNRFERAILQGGFARRPLARAEAFACCWARYLPGTVGHVPCMDALINQEHRGPFVDRPDSDWQYFLHGQGRTPLRAFAQRALLMHRLDLRPRLPAIPHPVLLVCGDGDPLVARSCQTELRAGLPRAAEAEIEHCGHHPYLSHLEVLSEIVQRFLSLPAHDL
jgi:pimeloyl-ACP methyl ester carboxylesterase